MHAHSILIQFSYQKEHMDTLGWMVEKKSPEKKILELKENPLPQSWVSLSEDGRPSVREKYAYL